jgi:DNA polymerase-3 subunit epsilon
VNNRYHAKTVPIFFDTETTGLDPNNERIIEIAAVDGRTGKSFVQLINPNKKIPLEASRIHNITDAMVQEAQDFKEVGKLFLDFCKQAGADSPGPYQVALIAHNHIGFDLPFLKKELARNQLELPVEWVHIDSLYWARHYRSDLPKHALQYLRQIYGITANQAHRALDDVIILKEVFEAMIGDLDFDWVIQKALQIQGRR